MFNASLEVIRSSIFANLKFLKNISRQLPQFLSQFLFLEIFLEVTERKISLNNLILYSKRQFHLAK